MMVATEGSLGAAIQDVGFPCEQAIESQRTDGNAWRVACAGAATYVAFTTDDGDICIEPIVVGDLPGPDPVFSAPARCKSSGRL